MQEINICPAQVAHTPDPDIQPVRTIRQEVWREYSPASPRRLRGQQGPDHCCGVQGK